MENLTELIEAGVAYIAILMPVLLIWVIFFFRAKVEKSKYEAMVAISNNLEEPSDVEGLLENFKEKKKPIDYKRNGVLSMFMGLGLFLFGAMSFFAVLKGVGLLVGTIGIGSLIAGYIYPNESGEINKAVNAFEKK